MREGPLGPLGGRFVRRLNLQLTEDAGDLLR
jgi:hypothetical protein